MAWCVHLSCKFTFALIAEQGVNQKSENPQAFRSSAAMYVELGLQIGNTISVGF